MDCALRNDPLPYSPHDLQHAGIAVRHAELCTSPKTRLIGAWVSSEPVRACYLGEAL